MKPSDAALGKKKKRRASGTIIDTTFADNVYSGVILTSASLIKTSPKENAVINELKVYIPSFNFTSTALTKVII